MLAVIEEIYAWFLFCAVRLTTVLFHWVKMNHHKHRIQVITWLMMVLTMLILGIAFANIEKQMNSLQVNRSVSHACRVLRRKRQLPSPWRPSSGGEGGQLGSNQVQWVGEVSECQGLGTRELASKWVPQRDLRPNAYQLAGPIKYSFLRLCANSADLGPARRILFVQIQRSQCQTNWSWIWTICWSGCADI